MAKKKIKSGRKKAPKNSLKDMSPELLLEQGRQCLQAGKARDALTYLKQAGKKDGFSETIRALIFDAYLLRTQQLQEKGLSLEAESMMQLAQDFMPSYEDMPPEILKTIVDKANTEQAVNIYASYLNHHASCPTCEMALADRIVESHQWELLESLPDTSRLKDHIDCIQQAAGQMDEGKWEDALESLQPVSRQSPFAPFRLFCRGMTAFLNNDEKTMQKAFSLIPDTFSLMPVITLMRQPLQSLPADLNAGDIAVLHQVWEGPILKEKYVAELFSNLKQKRFSQLPASIGQLAKIICPENQTAAEVFILKCIWRIFLHDRYPPRQTIDLVNNLLPRKIVDVLMANLQLQFAISPFAASGENIELLNQQFADPDQKAMAKSLILLKLVERVLNEPEWIDRDLEGIEDFHHLLGITHESLQSGNTELFLLDIADEALRLDPDNRDGYLQAARLPHRSRAAKTKMENLLQRMVKRFSDDPWPCLELAAVYYEKNAYRKAEAILAEAMKRAPHDRQVLERHVIALLTSIKINLNRRQYNPAWKDLERATEFSSPKTAPLIAEKKILLHILDRQQSLDEVLKQHMASFELSDQLIILAMLKADMQNPKLRLAVKTVRKLEPQLSAALKKISQLSSKQLLQLMLPWGRDYVPLITAGRLFDAAAIKKHSILSYLNPDDFSRILERIIEPELFPVIQKEIRKRLKTELTPNDRIRLEFYLIIIRHYLQDINEFDTIAHLVGKANGELKEELRRIARRFSDFFDFLDPLHAALARFDFENVDDIEEDIEDIEIDDDLFDDEPDDNPVAMWEELDFDKSEIEAHIDHFMDSFRPMATKLEELTMDSHPRELMQVIDSIEKFASELYEINNADAIAQKIRSFPDLAQRFDILKQLIDRYKLFRLSARAILFIYGNSS